MQTEFAEVPGRVLRTTKLGARRTMTDEACEYRAQSAQVRQGRSFNRCRDPRLGMLTKSFRAKVIDGQGL